MFKKKNEAAEPVAQTAEKADKEKKHMSKRAKLRTASGVMAALVAAAVIIVNMLAGAVAGKVNTKIDLTSSRVLDFADETLDVLKKLDKEIQIYSLIPDSVPSSNQSIIEAADMVDVILEKYSKLSDKITYTKIDTLKNPEFASKYDDPAMEEYPVVFDCGDKYKVVSINDIVSVNSETQNAQYLSAEQKFTSAIMFVSSENLVKVGVVQGHGERAYEESAKSLLQPENYDTVEINLLNGAVPEDIDMLFISSPATDFSADEINVLDAFFDRGGKAQLILDYIGKELPVLESYLKEWGVTVYNGYVIEESSDNIYNGVPAYVFASLQDTPVTSDIIKNNMKLLYPQARGMKITPVSGVENLDLLTSSDDSYVKLDFSDQNTDKTDGDIEGPAVIATILTRFSQNGNPQFMIMGGSGIFAGSGVTAANEDFFYNSISYMTGNEGSIYIRPKDISPNVLWLSFNQVLIIAGITVVLIPILILAAGFIVWFKRRHL